MCEKCNNLEIEFYRRNKKLPARYEFKRNSNLDIAFKLPPKAALEYLKNKTKYITTEKWNELDTAAHDKAFTVAKVMSADLLQLIHDKVVKAKQTGMTLKDFQKELLPELEKAGWSGTAGRLRVIYETNMRVAYAKEKYKAHKLMADRYPYWRYKQIEKKNKRLDHSKFHNKVFRHDDPIWSSIYPPSAFGCKCTIEPLSEAEVKSLGLKIDDGSNYDVPKPDLQVLSAWEPETNKYVASIRKQLQESINPTVNREKGTVESSIKQTNEIVKAKSEINSLTVPQDAQDKVKQLEEKISKLSNPNLPGTPLGQRINKIWFLLPAYFNKKDLMKIEKIVREVHHFDDLPVMLRSVVMELEKTYN